MRWRGGTVSLTSRPTALVVEADARAAERVEPRSMATTLSEREQNMSHALRRSFIAAFALTSVFTGVSTAVAALTVVTAAGPSFSNRISSIECKAPYTNGTAVLVDGRWQAFSDSPGVVNCPIPNASDHPALAVTNTWADFYYPSDSPVSGEITGCVVYFNGDGGTCYASATTPSGSGYQRASTAWFGPFWKQHPYDYPYLLVTIGEGVFNGYGVSE
jgi:hypothetical protein